MNPVERVIDYACEFDAVTEAWEFVHAQTFERLGLRVGRSKTIGTRTKLAFDLGREVERERWQPKEEPPETRWRGHLRVVQ